MENPVGPVEALELALSKEIEAKEMYQKMAVDFPAAKDVLYFLANEEEKHQKLIKGKISELTGY